MGVGLDENPLQVAFIPVENGVVSSNLFFVSVSDIDSDVNIAVLQSKCQMIFTDLQIFEDFGRNIDFAAQHKEF